MAAPASRPCTSHEPVVLDVVDEGLMTFQLLGQREVARVVIVRVFARVYSIVN